MTVEEVLRVAVIAVAAVLCAAVLKKTVPELALVLTLTAGALLLFSVVERAEEVRAGLDRLVELSGMAPELMEPVLKVLGIAVATRITAEVCRDAKEGGLAAFAEIAGAVLALGAALPLMEQVFDGIGRLL